MPCNQSELTKEAIKLAASFKNMPEPDKIGKLYDDMDPVLYDELLKVINFTEPQYIIDCIVNRPEDGGLGLPSTSHVFDCAMGTGLIG